MMFLFRALHKEMFIYISRYKINSLEFPLPLLLYIAFDEQNQKPGQVSAAVRPVLFLFPI